MINVTIKPMAGPRGKGFWRLQTFLLEREDYCERMEECIQDSVLQSADLSPATRWELMKYKIRDVSIEFVF